MLRGLTNFTSCAGINNGAIILSPGMRSGVSMLTFKWGANGFNLVISYYQHQNMVFGPKMVCLYFSLCKRRNIWGAAPGKHHIEHHHVPHSTRKTWVRSRLTRLVWWQNIFSAWQRQTTYFKNCHRKNTRVCLGTATLPAIFARPCLFLLSLN